ncbi:MAG: DNA-processing protein DprA [Sarcina sp.]
MISEEIYKLWFIAIPLLGEKKIMLLKTGYSYKEIYENREDLFKSQKNYKKILEISLNSDKIKKIEEGLKNKFFQVVVYGEDNYPKQLNFIEDKPFALFYKGKIEKINKLDFIAIVGSREATEYGLHVTEDIVEAISSQNVGLISGGALGIDSKVHKLAVEKDVFNIAVLGSGINVDYPKANKNLFLEIVKNGVILTEYLPDEKPYPFNFPYRNRLISGISKGTLVIESKIKSGASITASYAAEQGKAIVAVPGSIYSPLSEGCNKLISDGAVIYNNIENMFFHFNIKYVKNGTSNRKNYPLKLKILKILEENPRHIEEIKRETNVDISIINELLFEMQFNNEIIGLTGNYFAKIL